MYFSAVVDGVSHLWRQRFPDGAPEPLTSGSATEEEGVAVAPDGASLITSLGRRQSSVWMQDPRGERLLSGGGFAFDPSLSADGARVYYLLRRTGTPGTAELTMVDIASGRSDRLLPDFSGRAGSCRSSAPRLPDRRSLGVRGLGDAAGGRNRRTGRLRAQRRSGDVRLYQGRRAAQPVPDSAQRAIGV
jgi:hypothetical protein